MNDHLALLVIVSSMMILSDSAYTVINAMLFAATLGAGWLLNVAGIREA